MTLLLFAVLLVLLFCIPFLPGFRELVIEEDVAPLFIDMDYRKEPRYFGAAFRKLLLNALKGSPAKSGRREIVLSRPETVEVFDMGNISQGRIMRDICFVKQDLHSGNKVLFEKEVFVQGSAYVGAANQLRALACDGDAHVQGGVKLIRWLDAEGSIRIEAGSDLGISASSGGQIIIAGDCSFKRLYGLPVITGEENRGIADEQELGPEHAIVFGGEAERDVTSIPDHALKDVNIIAAKSLTIGESAWIRGDIKTRGDLTAGRGATIAGNIFAEGDVYLGGNCRVLGTVFSQGSITFAEGVTVGCKGKIKSVISKKGTTFARGVKVYGFVLTEGEGKVV